jgi:hypothetical protein
LGVGGWREDAAGQREDNTSRKHPS